MTRAKLSTATIARLPVYLRVLDGAADAGQEHVSSTWLSEATGITANVLRKDLSNLGSMGTRGVGYHVETLRQALATSLGLDTVHSVAIVGAGHLGRAIAGYRGFGPRGYRIAAIVDIDEQLWGTKVAGLVVQPASDLKEIVDQHGISFAILAVPVHSAQAATKTIVAAGIRGILNFAPVELQVPENVKVRGIDLAHELQILTYHSTGEI